MDNKQCIHEFRSIAAEHGLDDHQLEALRHAVEQLEAMQWRDIESAPKDGTRILAEYHGQIDAVSFCPEYKQWLADDGDWMSCNHWMPLPKAPEQGG